MKMRQTNIRCVDIYKTNKKIKLEEDSTLPDYCSDISRIIKVDATPYLISKKTYVKGDTLFCEVSGRVEVCFVYVSDTGAIESHAVTLDYYDTSKAEVGMIEGDSLFAFVTPVVDSAVCKVQSPRRVSARVQLNLDTDVRANTSFDSFQGNAEDGVQVKSYDITCLKGVDSRDVDFSVTKELKLPRSLLPMDKILCITMSMGCESTGISDSAVNFWGNANISATYISDSDDSSPSLVEGFYQPIEIKGAVELDDIRSDMVREVNLVPSSLKYEILPDSMGDNRILKVDFSYTAQCCVSENTPVTLTGDVYGIGKRVIPATDKVFLKKYLGALRETTTIKEKIPLKSNIASLEGAGVRLAMSDTYFEDGELWADVRATFGAIGLTDDAGVMVSEEMPLKIHLNLPSEFSGVTDSLSLDLHETSSFVDVRVEEGEASVSFDIITTADVFEEREADFVSSVDTEDIERDECESIFYYPSDKDTLWDIGKKYSVGIDTLKEANSIVDDELPSVIVI